jgi:hypothetical protein
MCGLVGFREIWGLDMRFLGGKWQKKNNGNDNGNGMSYFAMPIDFGRGPLNNRQ